VFNFRLTVRSNFGRNFDRLSLQAGISTVRSSIPYTGIRVETLSVLETYEPHRMFGKR
jgi:hypothetical protein